MSTLRVDKGWADVLVDSAADVDTADRLIRQLIACEVAALAFCRLLERYLLELEAGGSEGRTWYGGPGVAELLDWEPVLQRAGVRVPHVRVAQAYLELAVLIRALEGLAAAAQLDAVPDRASLWAGLFDLRENLLGRAVEDLRALAA